MRHFELYRDMIERLLPAWRRGLMLIGLAAMIHGCTSYHPLPLARRSRLAGRVADLRVEIPAVANGGKTEIIDTSKPIDIDRIGLLAILNNPGLKSEVGELGVAQAGVTQASVLPNPSVNVSYAALLGGAATVGGYTASLSQDVASIVTYRSRIKSAESRAAAVNADLLWREWQVAQKARLLSVDLYWADQSIGLSERELSLLSEELTQVRAAIAAGNLELSALAPLLAAKASAEDALATVKLDRLKNWQALDALLGLRPDVRFSIARPRQRPSPPKIDALIESLPQRRPDLVALQLGYRSSDENVRTAVLGQFPAFILGGSWNSDTSNIRSGGPTFTFDLPIFNRNQGQIAQARATRLLLHQQYQSRLDETNGTIRGLVTQIQRLSADLVQARAAARSAESLLRDARRAYAQGNLDQRTLTDYETTALHRELHVVDLERTSGEDRVSLTMELAIGLPNVRIAPLETTKPL